MNPNFKHIPSKVEIEQTQVYEINPPYLEDNELIVDFLLILQPQKQTDLVSSDVIIYSTNFNRIYKADLEIKESLELIFSHKLSKCLISDHYIS